MSRSQQEISHSQVSTIFKHIKHVLPLPKYLYYKFLKHLDGVNNESSKGLLAYYYRLLIIFRQTSSVMKMLIFGYENICIRTNITKE